MQKTAVIVLLFFITCFATIGQKVIPVYFSMDQRVLNEDQKSLLNNNLETIKSFDVIEINGYADYVGDVAYNKKLSLDRACHVKNYLVYNGVISEKIKIEGKGEQEQPENPVDCIGVSDDRRVDIICYIEKGEGKVANTDEDKNTQNQNLKDLDISKLDKGDHIVLPQLNFYGGRHFLLPQSVPVLDTLFDIMNNNPQLKIEIQGHICCEFNQKDGLDYDTGDMNLSLNRAKYVYDQLVKRGIKSYRMTYKGFGRSKPIIEFEKTEPDRIINRRVEIMIIDK